jgi:hypothetical protein
MKAAPGYCLVYQFIRIREFFRQLLCANAGKSEVINSGEHRDEVDTVESNQRGGELLTGKERRELARRLNARSASTIFVKLSEPVDLPSGERCTHVLVGNIITFGSQTHIRGLEKFAEYFRSSSEPRQLVSFAFCNGADGRDACDYDFTYTLDEAGNVSSCDEPEISQEQLVTVKTSRYCTAESVEVWKFARLIERGDQFLKLALGGQRAILPPDHRFNLPASVKIVKD